MNNVEILRSAMTHLAKGWTIGMRGIDKVGGYTNGWDDRAVAWCAMGAIDAVLGTTINDHEVVSLLSAQIDDADLPYRYRSYLSTVPHQFRVAQYNNSHIRVAQYNNSHTQQDVLNLFQRTIDALSESECRKLDPAFIKFKEQLEHARESVAA